MTTLLTNAADLDESYLLWSTPTQDFTNATIFPGIFVAGTSPYADTRLGWLDTSGAISIPKIFDPVTSTYITLIGAPGLTWLGTWSSATAYVPTDVVYYAGSSYICILSNTNAQPDTHTGDWSIIASIGPTGLGLSWKGAWNSGTSYAINDMVGYSGSSYICILANTNEQPDINFTYWSLMAEQGIPGIQGTGLSSVYAVTTSNISSLSGTTTIDGLAVTAGERALLVNQTTATQNGIWLVQSGAWTRPTDYLTGAGVLCGTMCWVVSGSTFANTMWVIGGIGAITVDTTSVAWNQAAPNDFSAIGAVDAVSTSNISSLSGTTTIDSVSMTANKRALLTAQTTSTENGIWIVESGAWSRPQDFLTNNFVPYGSFVFSITGTVNANTIWALGGATGLMQVDVTTSTTWTNVTGSGGGGGGGGSSTLAGDTDVSLASLSNGQVLTYNTSTSKWENVSPIVYLLPSNNLSDLGSASTARTNLGLGSAATHSTTDFDAAGAAATALTAAEANAATLYIPLTERGANSGVAELDSGGKVPLVELPTIPATSISYSDTVSGLTATNVQAALDQENSLLQAVFAASNGLITGGVVTWVTGYTYSISAGTAYINSVLVTWVTQSVTLTTPDATNNRIDVIGIDNTGTAFFITGVPAPSPVSPDINPATQLQLDFATVIAASTQPPNLNIINIYQEGSSGEWNTIVVNPVISPTFNPLSSNSPYQGSTDIEVTGASVNNSIRMQASAPLSLSNQHAITMYVMSKGAWSAGLSLAVCFCFNNTRIGNYLKIQDGTNFDSSNTSTYQLVTFQISGFGTSATLINQLKLIVKGGSGTLGCYIDDIQMQFGGTNGFTNPNTLAELSDVDLTAPVVGQVLTYNGTFWVNNPITARAPITLTSASIATGASDNTQTLAVGKNGEIYSMSTNVPAAVRLYSTAAAQAADAQRSVGAPIPLSAGVVAECITSVNNLGPYLRTFAYTNMDATPNTYLYATFINLSGTTQTITANIEYMRIEL